jgi:hypothetical protein
VDSEVSLADMEETLVMVALVVAPVVASAVEEMVGMEVEAVTEVLVVMELLALVKIFMKTLPE